MGEAAGDWQVGDPVMGTYPSSYAEYLVADHRFVLARPPELAPEIACGLPTALLTEQGALRAAGFAAGQSVLVTGATTGIGLVGLQLVRALGASKVITTTRRADRRALLTELGADAVVVTAEQDLTETVLAETDGASTWCSTTWPDRRSRSACPRRQWTATS